MDTQLSRRFDAATALLSAAIFGYVGFYQGWINNGLPDLLFFLLIWSIRSAAVGYAISGVMTLAGLASSAAIHLGVAAGTSILFVFSGGWLLVEDGPASIMALLLLGVGLWNGLVSWPVIRRIAIARAATRPG
jgi:hypothetical protein